MIVEARLIKRKTDDGLMELEDHVPLGRIYRVDTHSRRVWNCVHIPSGRVHEKEMIQLYPHQPCGWLPVELLELLGAP